MFGTALPAILIVGGAILLTVLLVPALVRFAPRWKLLDEPGGRKRHDSAVPLVGGLAIMVSAFAALALSMLWWPYLDAFSWWYVLVVAIMLVAGVLDDAFGLRYWFKALLQVGAILPLVFLAGTKLVSFGALAGGGPVLLGYAALPITIVFLLGYVNAVNMIDGLDGLAGGVTVIALAFLAVVAWIESVSTLFLVCLAFLAATSAFLAYNLRTPWRSRATVFLGDAGSMALGLIVGGLAIELAGDPGRDVVAPMGFAWILALPVMDTVVVMTRRLLRKRNPFAPDRLHLHHVLLDLGLSPGRATAGLLALASLYGMYGLLGSLAEWPDWVLFVSFIGVFACHISFVVLVRRRVRVRRTRKAALQSAHSDTVVP